jgi:nitroreductase
MDAFENLLTRRSVRKFTGEQVKEADLERILEAGTFAPSGHGSQSSFIVVLRKQGDIEAVEKLNAEVLGNPAAKPFFGAKTVLTVFADPAVVPTWADDGNMVISNLLHAAHALGLGSCYIYRARASFEKPEGLALMKKWGLTETCKGVGNVILGYPADKPSPAPRKSGYIVRV